MDNDTLLFGIKDFLLIPPDDTELEEVLEKKALQESDKTSVLNKIYHFIQFFELFKNIPPFMKSIYMCIKKSLEIQLENVADLEELMIKTTLMYLIQEYVKYANLSQKEQVLNFLASSFEKLAIKPLMLNLGLLVKPMYQDNDYLASIEIAKEVEIAYIHNEEIEIKIKEKIHEWLNTYSIDLEHQAELKGQLEHKFNNLVDSCSLEKDSEKCKELFEEVLEMLNMKLTLLSLEDQFQEESFEPVPIK